MIVYIFMYDFLKDQDKVDLYLPWGAWTCLWAGVFIAILAVLNTCSFIDKFTRFSGELFGMLIGILFMQQAITGLMDEFKIDKNVDSATIDPNDAFDASRYHWRLVNGLWSLVLHFLLTENRQKCSDLGFWTALYVADRLWSKILEIWKKLGTSAFGRLRRSAHDRFVDSK